MRGHLTGCEIVKINANYIKSPQIFLVNKKVVDVAGIEKIYDLFLKTERVSPKVIYSPICPFIYKNLLEFAVGVTCPLDVHGKQIFPLHFTGKHILFCEV